ncbi:MAG: choice-of-anchor D domain-containing protein [Acidobacteria bacterium]|nr:choice-of-anchor D domain-containing protein [Acidobacteriota bacterium]
MTRCRCFSILLLAALVSLSLPAVAQTSLFTVRVQYGTTAASYTEGATLTVPADAIGVATPIIVTITYRGAATADIRVAEVAGHTDFSIPTEPQLPVTLRPNDSFAVSVRYLPSSGTRVSGQVGFGYTEGRTSGRVSVSLAGVAPEFSFSYTPQGGNATLVEAGGTVSFPATAVNATSQSVFVLTNRGSGPGAIGPVALSGADFQLVGAPLRDTVVDAGKDVRFSIAFTPKQLETSQGLLAVNLPNRQVSFNLSGTGSAGVITYEIVREGIAAAISPNQAILMPEAVVGDKTTISMRVRNAGNADGVISAISIQGAGFALSDVPFLPLTLAPGASAAFTLTFSPTQPGWSSARLRIGADTFDVRGAGLGPQLAFAYTVGETTSSVQSNGSVFFTPSQVGRSTSALFFLVNNGTAPATVNNISITGTTTAFTLSGTPGLPLTLSPGATSMFTIQFAPTASGATTATLKVDANTFTLSGTAAAPDALPAYRFEAPSGSQEPMKQPAISLTLAAAYPLPLTGALTLNFFSNAEVPSPDPTVQFATGGRTVNFTIPANTTRAVFAHNATQIGVQTGTVAGTITITPAFATDTGINLTPTNPPALNLVIPASVPKVLGFELSAKTATSITLIVRGYSTSRAVTKMDFQFTPTSGENVSTTSLSLPVEGNFLGWYQQTQSQQYGSQFTATVTFTLQGDVKNVTSVSDTIQSVAVTLTNRQGVSASQSVALR